MKSKKEILRKTYESPDEYVLEALEADEEEIFMGLFKSIPKEFKNEFNRFIEISTFISDSRIKLAYRNGVEDGLQKAKSSLLESLKDYEF